MKLFYEIRKYCFILLLGILVFSSVGCSSSNNEQLSQPHGYPISSDVYTTRERTVVPEPVPITSPTIYPYQIALYNQYGYGVWKYGPPSNAGKMTLSPDYDGTSVTNTARLLNFFAMSDIHISDKESPAQCIYNGYKGGSSSAYSAVKLLTTQVLDAAVQTINALHERTPFDFGMSLGDACDNTQYNELRWFMDVLDGKVINPASCPGVKEDPIPGPYNDYQDQYKAAGINKAIKWYQVIGNHDHFWMGSLPVNDYARSILTGLDIINWNNVYPFSMDNRGYYQGAIDGRTVYGDIIGAGAVADFPTPPQVLAANPNRRSLSRNEWIGEFFNTSSSPVGHGFSQDNAQKGFACYSFEPKANIPIKVIVLDDTQSEYVSNLGFPYSFGYLDQERYDWLVGELDKGQAEGKLMIVAAHVPIGVYMEGSPPISLWSITSPISQDTLINKLHTYPNLILWMAGHRHCNAITPFQSTDPSHPELGFWEIETASLRDFPQEFRTFEIVRNSDNTISIITTDVDPAVAEGSLAALSRTYAVASQELFNNTIGYLPSGTCNAELIKQLSAEMQTKIQNYGTPIK